MSFGRLSPPRPHRPMSEINITPLVDVVLVLLVLFILAAPLMASRLALQLPAAEAPPAPPPARTVQLALDARGQLRWDGQALSPEAARERLARAAQDDPSTELQLRADAAVPYGRVVQLIGWAQAAGLSRIGFVAAAPPAAR